MSLFSLYCIWSTLFSTAALEVRLTAFLGGVIIMGYLYYPASKKHNPGQPDALVRLDHHDRRRGELLFLLLPLSGPVQDADQRDEDDAICIS